MTTTIVTIGFGATDDRRTRALLRSGASHLSRSSETRSSWEDAELFNTSMGRPGWSRLADARQRTPLPRSARSCRRPDVRDRRLMRSCRARDCSLTCTSWSPSNECQTRRRHTYSTQKVMYASPTTAVPTSDATTAIEVIRFACLSSQSSPSDASRRRVAARRRSAAIARNRHPKSVATPKNTSTGTISTPPNWR